MLGAELIAVVLDVVVELEEPLPPPPQAANNADNNSAAQVLELIFFTISNLLSFKFMILLITNKSIID
ncbi:hypothetical protein FHQ21_04705 [Testudinibacter aquarius]|uniref:Uncharacterized protein n=1 Tax=Testudinibacter aquarius TaxID=1524974 RepID=A0ABY2XX54_9PAST|nr:hypothetical protein FHQ21_04705 [Testudinibacter aquarius]